MGDQTAFLPLSAGSGLSMPKSATSDWDVALHETCMQAAAGHTMQRMFLELSKDGTEEVTAKLPEVSVIKKLTA